MLILRAFFIQRWSLIHLKAFYLFLYNKKMMRFSLTSAVRLSFAHIDGLVQTTPKCPHLKDQETIVIDEFTSDIDALLIDGMYFL